MYVDLFKLWKTCALLILSLKKNKYYVQGRSVVCVWGMCTLSVGSQSTFHKHYQHKTVQWKEMQCSSVI